MKEFDFDIVSLLEKEESKILQGNGESGKRSCDNSTYCDQSIKRTSLSDVVVSYDLQSRLFFGTLLCAEPEKKRKNQFEMRKDRRLDSIVKKVRK